MEQTYSVRKTMAMKRAREEDDEVQVLKEIQPPQKAIRDKEANLRIRGYEKIPTWNGPRDKMFD